MWYDMIWFIRYKLSLLVKGYINLCACKVNTNKNHISVIGYFAMASLCWRESETSTKYKLNMAKCALVYSPFHLIFDRKKNMKQQQQQKKTLISTQTLNIFQLIARSFVAFRCNHFSLLLICSSTSCGVYSAFPLYFHYFHKHHCLTADQTHSLNSEC